MVYLVSNDCACTRCISRQPYCYSELSIKIPSVKDICTVDNGYVALSIFVF